MKRELAMKQMQYSLSQKNVSQTSYKSKYYQQTLKDARAKQEIAKAKAELREILIEKRKKYAAFVKDVHTPVVSQKKSKELENLKTAMKHPVRTPNRDQALQYTRAWRNALSE